VVNKKVPYISVKDLKKKTQSKKIGFTKKRRRPELANCAAHITNKNPFIKK